jgi:sec-independent protein translocase protein TatA
MFAGLASPTHLLLLLVLIILLFGAKRLPEMGRSLGRGLQEFNAGLGSKEKPEDNKENPSRAIEDKEHVSTKRASQAVEEKENASMVGSDVIETLVSSSPQGRGLMWLWRKL